MQTAPSLWQATTYALFDVAVQKGAPTRATGGASPCSLPPALPAVALHR